MKIAIPNLALLKRTLLLDNRAWQGYIARLILLVTILVMLSDYSNTYRYSTFASAPGLYFLQTVVVINVLAITFLGIATFVPAITEEKEADALGILMMTGIGPLPMLASKGGAKLFAGIALVAAQIPFTFLAVTMGGVSSIHIAAAYLFLFSYMFAIAGIAIFLSVVCASTRVAGTLCYGAIIIFTLISAANSGLVWLSPYNRVGEIFTTGFQGPIFTIQTALYMATGAFFFVASWLIFDFCARNFGGNVPIRLGLSSKRRFSFLRLFHPGRVWGNAIMWKAFHFDIGGKMTLLIFPLAIILFMIVVCWVSSSSYSKSLEWWLEGSISLSSFALLIEGALISETIFSREIKNEAISALMTMPRSLAYIAYSKIFGALLATTTTVAILFLGIAGLGFRSDGVGPFSYGSEGLGLLIMLVTMAITYFHITVYLSLKIKYGAFALAGFAQIVSYMLFGSIATFTAFSSLWDIVILVIASHLPIMLVAQLLIAKNLKAAAAAS